jgi:hypothetical protein
MSDVYEETMKEIVDEAANELNGASGSVSIEEHRGDAAYQSKSVFKKKTTYIPSEGHSVRKLLDDAKELCTESSNLAGEDTNIGLTFVYPCISKKVYAHILKPSRLLKMHAGYDLILEISGVAWDNMNEDERQALLHHELEHVNFKEKRDGSLELRLIDHTVKDFANILDLYGIYYIRAGLNEEEE